MSLLKVRAPAMGNAVLTEMPAYCCSGEGNAITIDSVTAYGVASDANPPNKAVHRHEVKMGDEDTATKKEWEIMLHKTPGGPSLGLSLYVGSGFLVVQDVDTGLVQAWNKENPGEKVTSGATIIGVNDAVGDSQQLFDALRSQKDLRIRLIQVYEFEACIETSGTLGIDIKQSTMQVTNVSDAGAVEMYNRTCLPGCHISAGDTIISVNGVLGDSTKMIDEIARANGEVKLAVKRSRH